MTTNNTMRKDEFYIEHIVWALISFIWYKSIFRCIGALSLGQSKLILVGICIFVFMFFCMFDIKSTRNSLSVFMNVICAYGVYTVIAYYQFANNLIRIANMASFTLSILCVTILLTRKISNRRKVNRILRGRIFKSVRYSQLIFSLGFILIIGVILINEISGKGIIHTKSVYLAQTNADDQTLSKNIETIALLEQNKWEALTDQEKVDVLQAVANGERHYLGLPHGLHLGASNLEKDNYGIYRDSTHQIILDLDHLHYDSPDTVLNTVLHEAYHAFEHRCWDIYVETDLENKSLMLFQKARMYGNEFADYEDGNEDFNKYYMQECEIDAREYAEAGVKEYLRRIREFYDEQ